MKRLVVFILAVMAGARTAPATFADETAGETPSGGFTQFLEDQRVSGVWRADYFRSSKTLDDQTGFIGATAQLKALPSISETVDGKVEIRVTNPDIGDGGGTESRLIEGYATFRFAQADLRIGKQIVAWGRADGINPTDNLTPRDFITLLPFEDDQRFGTTGARLDTFLSAEHTLTVFATPFFQPSEIPLPTTGRTYIEKPPAHTLSDTEVGLRLNKVGEGFDWSVSYFRGFSLFPDMRVVGSTAVGPTLEVEYNRISVFGADFARNYGRFGFRGEVAYVDTSDEQGSDPSIKNPYLYWIVGVDRTFLDNLNVNLQFFQRRVRQHRNPEAIADATEREIALQNAIIDGQRDRISNGISFRVSNKWFNDTLEAEVFAVVNFTRDNSFIRPLVTYAFTDHWKGTLGAEFYRGAADTQYGSLKANRGAFAELRYGF